MLVLRLVFKNTDYSKKLIKELDKKNVCYELNKRLIQDKYTFIDIYNVYSVINNNNFKYFIVELDNKKEEKTWFDVEKSALYSYRISEF